MKLSIGIISRGRPNYLSATIINWLTTADIKEDLDFVIALDDDDKESIKTYNDIQHIITFFGASSSLITWPPMGYINLYKRNNQMLPHYKGEVLLIICDDNYVTTPGWDRIISNDVNKVYDKDGKDRSILVWMCGKNNEKQHPDMYGLNRKWLDIAGKYTITPGTDSNLVKEKLGEVEYHKCKVPTQYKTIQALPNEESTVKRNRKATIEEVADFKITA